MEKIVPREVKEEPKDVKYECFRAIKTFLVIIAIFCFAFIVKKQYFNMLANSRFVKFYPENTLFYMDYSNGKDFSKIKLPKTYEKLSYGIFKDNRGNERFLIVASTDEEDTPIIDKKKYSQFTKYKHVFISDSTVELEALHERLKLNKHDYLSNANIKKSLKKLDNSRTNTIIISDANYINLPVSNEVKSGLNKVFDNAVIQSFEDNDTIKFNGEINFKNNIATFLTNIKQLSGCFEDRKIKISNFKNNDVSIIVGVKDFDLWTQSLVKITQNIPNNQYSYTLKLIQSGFNSNLEEDIVKNFNGNAVLYIFNTKNKSHPMLSIEAKEDLTKQVQKYFTFLQLPNNLKLTEKEINKKTLNVLNSKIYPHNLVFGALENDSFLLGHQNIIEQYIEYKNNEFTYKDMDFYFYTNIDKTPVLKKKNSFLKNYDNLEVEVSLTPTLNFKGEIRK